MKNLSLLVLTLVASTFAQAATPSKYFIVQNIATEKMRVYERCTTSPDCAHRMVFQTDMVAGKISGTKDMWTRVGTYKIEKWVKFYEDNARNYPSWFDANYPPTPLAGNSFQAWTNKSAMPQSTGEMRGAFGWYAAMVTPNPAGQWIHGTIGWGSDADTFIKQTRSLMANIFTDPRSHGCTRLENRAVAFIQSFIPAGTDLFRVYALEATEDSQLQAYENQKEPLRFDFILTKDQVRKSNPNSIAKSAVELRLRDGILSSTDILEEGSYLAAQYPVGQGFIATKAARTGKSGDTYSLTESAFKGAFLIDSGRFVNYDHPAEMPRGGVSGSGAVLPDYAKSNSTNYTLLKAEKSNRAATSGPADDDLYRN